MRRAFALVLLTLALVGLTACSRQRPAPQMDFTLEQQGESLVVRVQVQNFRVPADGHVHVRLDDGPEAMVYQTTYTFPKVAPGTHTISVQLSDMQHNYLGSPQSKEITVK